MNARYAIALTLVGLVLTNCSGCVDTSQESVLDTAQTPVGATDDELIEEELESFENDLDELEAFLGGIEEIDDNTEIVNDSISA